MTFKGLLFACLVIAAVSCAGIVFNKRWKNSEEATRKLAPAPMLWLSGLLGWIGICLFLFKGPAGAGAACLGACLLICGISLIKGYRAGVRKEDMLSLFFTVLLAGLGKWMALILRWTLIGIPLVRVLEAVGDYGTDYVVDQMQKNAAESEKEPFSLFPDDTDSPSESTEAETKKEVDVWRENGLMIEHLKVNSDQSMYYDPDDEEWHKIPDKFRVDQ